MGETIDFPAGPTAQPDWLKTAQQAAMNRLEGEKEAGASPGEGSGSQGEPAAAGEAPELELPFRNQAWASRAPEDRPWLTLAAIVGNEAHHIARFVEYFEPLVDEIVLVRAIGRLKPDATLELAAAAVKKPLLLDQYFNDPNLEWEHVDNFANARQRAFDLATGRFVMWADADDIIEEEHRQRMRAQVDLGNFDVLLCPYRVIGSHPLVRERVIRKGIGRWVNACHEAVSLPPSSAKILRPDIEIFHYPLGDGKGGNKAGASLTRNLKILEHSVGPGALAFFYLHRDSLLKNDVAKALDWGKLAIASPNLTAAERYRVFFNIAMIFLARSDWAQMETFAMNGIREQPDRRECFCVLAVSYIERKNYPKALIWMQLANCINQPDPRNAPNWWDASWYGWRAYCTHAFILRKMQLFKEAQAIEDAEHDGHPMISLLHATRGRPQAAAEARERWFQHALKPETIEHIYAVDADDKVTVNELDGFKCVVVEPGGGCVRAWNAAAAIARGKVLIQMSDDWTPPYHWDNQIVWRLQDAIMGKKPAVLAISDGHRSDKLLCMAILTRDYYLRQKHEKTGEPYLFHPDYLGVYSDNEFTVRAYENGVVIEAKDLLFVHDHPIFTNGPIDATYAAQNSAQRYAQGLEVFNRRNPRYKIEPPEEPAAPAASREHLHFFDVGANVGQTFDDYLTKQPRFDGCHVWCFEPSPRHFVALCRKSRRPGAAATRSTFAPSGSPATEESSAST